VRDVQLFSNESNDPAVGKFAQRDEPLVALLHPGPDPLIGHDREQRDVGIGGQLFQCPGVDEIANGLAARQDRDNLWFHFSIWFCAKSSTASAIRSPHRPSRNPQTYSAINRLFSRCSSGWSR